MPSFTLRSSRVPWVALALLAVAALTWGGAAAYTRYANPELQFFLGAARLKTAWAKQLTARSTSKLVIVGGSSCAFAFDAQRLETSHGLPAVNYGLGAGMGRQVLIRAGLEHCRAGDVLVLALEPGLVLSDEPVPSLGVQFSVAMGKPEWLDSFSGAERYDRLSALLDMRPGGYHTVTLLGKLASHQPLYRYRLEEFSPGGWQQSPERRPIHTVNPPTETLPDRARAFLRELQDWTQRRQVAVYYVLPWAYAAPEDAQRVRRAHAEYLRQLADLVPVLAERELGVHTAKDDFADTLWHLRSEAARLRTDTFAEAYRQRRLWSATALERIIRAPADNLEASPTP